MVVGHEAVLFAETVHADEQLVDVELLGADAQHRADHHLRLVLEIAAQEHHLRALYAADIAGDEGAVGDDGHILRVFGDGLGKQRAATAVFDHHRFAMADQFGRLAGDLALLLIVDGEAVVDVVRAAKDGVAVLAANDAAALKHVQILAHRHLRNGEHLRQRRHLQPSVLGKQLQDRVFPFVHRVILSPVVT